MVVRASVLAMVATLVVLPGLASAWEAKVGSSGGDKGFAIAADAGSRVFAGGAFSGGTVDSDFAVLAFDSRRVPSSGVSSSPAAMRDTWRTPMILLRPSRTILVGGAS
jgi:hypothetical protein